MDLETLLSYEWSVMTPEFIIIGVATLLSLLDLFLGKNRDRRPLAWIGIVGIILAIIVVIDQLDHPGASILYDTYVLDSFSKAFKLIFLVGTAFVLLLAMSYEPKEGMKTYRGEFYYLLLTALLGAMMMASSADMITLFVGLELLSISSYILAGIRKENLKSNESAMKYVINGGISTAFILFGMSYIYGFTGSTNLYEVSAELQGLVNGNFQFIIALAFLMIFVGLSFKIATVPFYMWGPDVYEGAPTPVTAFLSVVSKAAGFVIIIRFFIISFFQAPGIGGETAMLIYMQDFIAVLAGITMIVGNTIALRQKNIKRLLAYSSIAHAGYLLVPFVALSAFMFEGLWFYLVAYLFMNLGIFALIQVITARNDSEEMEGFTGLYKRSPWIAIIFSVFLLSLAGIPGTAGFIGKLTIFIGALSAQPGHYVLVSVMMATTVISYYYYFGLMKKMFFGESHHEASLKLPSGVAVVVGLCVIGTIVLGIMPNLALDFFYNNLNLVDFFG